MISREEFNTFRKDFNDGGEYIDLIVRHLETGDEEETRLSEDYKDEDVRGGLRDTLPTAAKIREVPKEVVQDIIDYLHKCFLEDRYFLHRVDEDSKKMDEWIEKLLPYIANKGLHQEDFTTWECVLYSDTYEEFCEMVGD